MTLYHLIHRPFLGTTLYPLTRLRYVDRARFDHQNEKYKGREALRSYGIEAFDCLWNDVVHLSPIHPKDIFAALEQAGYPPSAKRRPYFFAIDPEMLDSHRTIFFHTPHGREEKYDPRKVAEYSVLADATRQYYREAIARKERPLLWNFTTHVLHHGEIDVSTVPIIDRHGAILEERAKVFGT
jgi:hypothetical protein